MRFTYDIHADALGIWLTEEPAQVVTRRLAPDVSVDIDDEGRLLSVEVLDASRYYSRATLEQLPTGKEFLTLAEAAVESGLSPATLRSQLNKGRLDSMKRGCDWLVSATAP